MSAPARHEYLRTQVMTATPQKLHLMLVQAAIRDIVQIQEHWEQQAYDDAAPLIAHCREVVAEMLVAVRVGNSAVSDRLAQVYLFAFQRLVEAQVHRDPVRLTEVLAVLRAQQDTWHQVCEKFGSVAADGAMSAIGGPVVQQGLSLEA